MQLLLESELHLRLKEKDERKEKIGSTEELEKRVRMKLNMGDLVQNIEDLKIDERDLVSKSPVRTQVVQSYSKPYEYPPTSSRSFGAFARGTERDHGYRIYSSRGCPRSGMVAPSVDNRQDTVDIREVNHWWDMCKKNPKALEDFIADFNEEVNRKEAASNLVSRRDFGKADGMSVCSNSSSQVSSPVQSPSEHTATSPESFGYEENSLYHSTSPAIPSLDGVNIKPSDDPESGYRFLVGSRREDVVNLTDPVSCSPSSESLSPNIETVMLNLDADTYESSVDLNKVARTWHQSCCPAPSVSEGECLNAKLDPKAKEIAWTRISQLNIDSLAKGDPEGDTQLMILLAKKENLEYVYVLVERFLKENPEYLSLRNGMNQDALYLAAFTRVREPFVASYIAEALIRGNQDVNKKYNEGNTLLHCLAKRGDSHVKVLERLVRLRNNDNTPAFDINEKNNRGYTPLHIACEIHKPETVSSCQTVRVLLENGADCSEKEYIHENTPVHVLINESCDAELLRILLSTAEKYRDRDGSPSTTNIANRQGNTALHLACRRNRLQVTEQKEVIEVLLRHGALIHLKNINGCVPSVFVDTSRKKEIKSILHSYSQKKNSQCLRPQC